MASLHAELVKPKSRTYRQIEDLVKRDVATDQLHRVRSSLQQILKSFRERLLVLCGGSPSGLTNRLPNCSWEEDMKAFILGFP